jgi:hypothetical protein
MQVLVGLNCGGMVAVLPALPSFALVVLLRGAAGDELDALSYDGGSRVVNKK